MADEKQKDAAWWEKQANQYKAELDQLNPRLNVAEAQIAELEATGALLKRERDDAVAEHQAAVSRENEAAARGDELQKLFDKQVNENGQLLVAVSEAIERETRMGLAIKQKNAALAPCLKSVADQLALLQAAVAAGA